MDYLTALQHATDDVRTAPIGGTDTELQAALALATHAWTRLAEHDNMWDWFALDVLDATAALYPDPAPLVLTVDAPTADTPMLRLWLAGLLSTIARRLRDAVADTSHSTTRRLQYAAAATQLRAAAGHLT